jgi:MGT family glycosyltransferase
MARILMATTPGDGHVNPMVPIARELVRRGHEVRWYTGRHYQPKVEKSGATFQPMRAGYDFGGKNKLEAFPRLEGLKGLTDFRESWKQIFMDTAPGQFEDLLALLAEAPADVLVADEMCFAAGLAREKAGVPLALVATSIYFYSSRDAAPLGLGLWPDGSRLGRVRNTLLHTVVDHVILRALRTHADELRARLGLPALGRRALENLTAPPELYLLGTVPSFEYPRSDLYPQAHFVGSFFTAPPDSFEPPAWWEDLKRGRPVVHVTQGTVTTEASQLLLPAIKALASEDVLVVATTGGKPVDSLQLDPVPANLRLERFIPHHHLLPHVDVMVTNGGYSGVQTALSNGVPLIVAGATEEKPEVAAHVAWAGVGLDLKTARPDGERLRAAVRTVLREPKYREKARRLQDEYRGRDAPRRSAELIEELARTRRPVLA